MQAALAQHGEKLVITTDYTSGTSFDPHLGQGKAKAHKEEQGVGASDSSIGEKLVATSGPAADALHPVFEAPAASVSVRVPPRSPLHAQLNPIQGLQ